MFFCSLPAPASLFIQVEYQEACASFINRPLPWQGTGFFMILAQTGAAAGQETVNSTSLRPA